jgi:RNA polymerase sigma factor (sigma-70 family)
MKKEGLTPLKPAEKRRVLHEARETCTIAWNRLDRLLLEACRTKPKFSALLRSLAGVQVVDAEERPDILDHALDLSGLAQAAGDTDHFNLYAEAVRSLPRLTRLEESILARRLEFAHARLEKAIDALDLPPETRELVLKSSGCRALDRALTTLKPQNGDGRLVSLPCPAAGPVVQRACADYNRLRGHFVERNLYLVIGMSSAYRTYGIPVMDLIQEGNASLIRAVEKFDWRKDVRFGTYAAFWVRQAIERMITANRGIVRVPNYIQQKMRRLRREGKLPRNQRDMDLRDVSQHFDSSMEAAARLMETDRAWFSLDATLGDDDSSFGSTIAAEEDEGAPISAAELRMLGRRLDEVLVGNLTAQERDILTMRFGLGGTEPRTLDEIGEKMSVSRERVRQMQVKALDKLQKPRLLQELKDYL